MKLLKTEISVTEVQRSLWVVRKDRISLDRRGGEGRILNKQIKVHARSREGAGKGEEEE